MRRITEDKFVARFIFLPVALSLAIFFLRDRKMRYLGLFTFVCLSVVAVHPLGLVLIGISMTGFGLVYLTVNWRNWRAWTSFGALGATMLSIVLPPVAYLLATGSPLLSRLASTETTRADSLLAAWQSQERLLELGDGSYIMHPALLLEPVILTAYVLGIPFLIWRLERSLAAQLLLGVLLFVPVLIYIPPVTTFIGGIVGPWTIWRLAWPIPLAALLTLGWMSWELLEYLRTHLSGLRFGQRLVPFLPLVFVCGLIAGATPLMVAGVRSADQSGEIAQDESSCLDPAFRWMQGVITITSPVLAPYTDNSCIPAYSTQARTLSYGGSEAVPDRSGEDLRKFFNAPTLDEEMIQILQRYGIKYTLLPANSPLNGQLDHHPAFTRMDNPGDRYQMYEVDWPKLEVTPAVKANSYLNQGKWDAAIASYKDALQGNEAEQFLAYVGLGRSYMGEKQYDAAAKSLEEARSLDPGDSAFYSLLSDAYNSADDRDAARHVLEQAIGLYPRDVELRSKLSSLLVSMDAKEAAKEQRSIVDMYPEVPEYRVKLGSILYLSGETEAADQQFERATRQDPLSADLQASVGQANLQIKRPEEALRHYKRALELDPDNQSYNFRVGTIYSALSTDDNTRGEEYFELAEKHLRHTTRLQPPSGRLDLESAAWLALGDLYRKWHREEEATTAYKRVLEISPEHRLAQERLKELGEEPQ